MQSFSTPVWGYKKVSDNSINFYHKLLSRISLSSLYTYIHDVSEIIYEQDGSITLVLQTPDKATAVIERILSFFDQRSAQLLETPNYYYKIDGKDRQILRTWMLSLEGCLAFLLTNDSQVPFLLGASWDFLNSKAGGLSIGDFTLLLDRDYPKVIHPITAYNYTKRDKIEEKTTEMIRKMTKRISQAQPRYEGVGLLSFVESKTNLPTNAIVNLLNEKSRGIQAPFESPFLG